MNHKKTAASKHGWKRRRVIIDRHRSFFIRAIGSFHPQGFLGILGCGIRDEIIVVLAGGKPENRVQGAPPYGRGCQGNDAHYPPPGIENHPQGEKQKSHTHPDDPFTLADIASHTYLRGNRITTIKREYTYQFSGLSP
jgi:hypothetical protein